MIDSGGGGMLNDQMQIVNTKLPNENIQTYQPQMIDSKGGGGKLPNVNCDQTTKWYHQSGSEWLRTANFAQFTTFPIFFPPKWLRMTQSNQFHPICNFSNLFPLKWLRMTHNGQFHLVHNFANLSPLEWLRMTRNGQFCLIHNFSNLFPPNDQFQGGG